MRKRLANSGDTYDPIKGWILTPVKPNPFRSDGLTICAVCKTGVTIVAGTSCSTCKRIEGKK